MRHCLNPFANTWLLRVVTLEARQCVGKGLLQLFPALVFSLVSVLLNRLRVGQAYQVLLYRLDITNNIKPKIDMYSFRDLPEDENRL